MAELISFQMVELNSKSLWVMRVIDGYIFPTEMNLELNKLSDWTISLPEQRLKKHNVSVAQRMMFSPLMGCSFHNPLILLVIGRCHSFRQFCHSSSTHLIPFTTKLRCERATELHGLGRLSVTWRCLTVAKYVLIDWAFRSCPVRNVTKYMNKCYHS